MSRTPPRPPARKPAPAPAKPVAKAAPVKTVPAGKGATATVITPAAAVAAPLLTLAELVAATRSPDGFLFAHPESVRELCELGYAEINTEILDGEKVAARASDAGIEFFDSQQAPVEVAPPAATWAQKATPPAVAETKAPRVKAPTGGFAIASVEMPAKSRTARERIYPFDELEIGQSFFVPNTDEHPDIGRTLAGTVSAANVRYSVEVEGQTRTTRRGTVAPMLKPLRKFTMRRVDDAAPWGFPGVAGAAVFRVEC